ncbi:MAG: NIPSNAP family protein [Rhodospirillales bacterium]|nr:NIPSNAP family protein [Rhodospirillales bacterium]
MIIEMRSYDLRPASVPAVEERFAASLPARTALSPLAAFWHTEIGPLNRVIHVWTYADLAERTRIRAEAAKLANWPPPIAEFVTAMTSEIYLPAPFSPPLEPRALGAVYEVRSYTMAAGQIPGMIERWSAKIGERAKLSPLVGAWYSELGTLNKWVHIWAYKDAAERQRIRAEAVARGIWPPGSPPGAMVKQENMLVVPAAFSPLR